MLVSLYSVEGSEINPYNGAAFIAVKDGLWSISNAAGSLIFQGREETPQPKISWLPNFISVSDGKDRFVLAFDNEARDIYENSAGRGLAVEFSSYSQVAKEAGMQKVHNFNWKVIIPAAGIIITTLYAIAADKRAKNEPE